jgi:hypothetical protein
MASAQQSTAQNLAIRANILQNSIPVIQNVRSGSMTYTYGVPTTVNMLASNVGLIRRFFLVLSGTVNCASTYTATPTTFGLPNLISNIQFTDQNNRLRINTTGIHLHLAATEKRRRAFGSAILGSTGHSDPCGLGQNFPVQVSTGVVSGGTAKNFTFILEIPVVNSNTDLSGAIYANQTTSNNSLQFTLNPNAFVANTADPYTAAFSMSAALGTSLPTLTNLTWTLYQDFLDQLPIDNTGFAVLPQQDISWALVYQNINPGVQVAGSDNLYALPAFNVYQNLILFWDNPAFNTTGAGADVDAIKVQVSNTYVLKQFDPKMLAVMTRNIIGCDMPGGIGAAGSFSGGVYSLDFRHKPLAVNQVSSTNIVFRPNTVNAGASLSLGQEYLWYANAAAS